MHDRGKGVKGLHDTAKDVEGQKGSNSKGKGLLWKKEMLGNVRENLDQKRKSKRYQLGVKRLTASRAKSRAKKLLEGDYTQQCARLRDYCLELQQRNPNTTIRIGTNVEANPNSETRQFKRIYICLGPLKEGFEACRRDLLGFDGAFMIGPYPGQVLTTVGVDPNNGIYPLAYAIVEAKCFNSWRWFLVCLGEDLDLSPQSNFTFMSDRQKGLVPAIAKLFPVAEHRFCLRHIYENMSRTFRGEIIRDLLWKCAISTTEQDFEAAMEELRQQNEGAYNYLKAVPPHHWSRAHFSGRAHCDILLHNICESFNSKLVEGREKPIISCLEYIREYLMKRIVIVQKIIDTQKGPLTPTASALFESIKNAANHCTALWNGSHRFQVKDSYRDQCVVDIQERTCSCRKWQLTGMPCKHAVCGIWNARDNSVHDTIVEDWVDPCYRLDTWKEVYSFKVEPVTGSFSWPKNNCPTRLLPPVHKTQVGRPKKLRRKSVMELEEGKMVKNGKLTRTGKTQ
uniref:uncharacterized protein LOC122604617 n=1 Tax=Erigeron canadensis TaxID=72917 RepID=UPI001CB95C42|nr:uncharacterized protein LOC122604617 [Erigeron canadensis]